ncbi:Glycoside hydrolase [Macleaya cordata]|uniref:Glycoside hydrolase n=1 Tax=Macleaya cordata TaxID=56857 RepID=A0A200PWM5_MACCD|nr:Glycoside hydrolase [Macleaya cordata]
MGRNEEEEESDLKSKLVRQICSISSRSTTECVHRRIRRPPRLIKPTFIDWYLLLRVEENAEIDRIRKQYLKFALQLHPDKNKHPKAEVAFKLVSEAYACLSDKARRTAFDFERSNNLCAECERVRFQTCNLHTEAAKKNKILQRSREVREKFRKEAMVIENCLKAHKASREEEYPLFDPSNYVFQDYPHPRTQMYTPSEDFCHVCWVVLFFFFFCWVVVVVEVYGLSSLCLMRSNFLEQFCNFIQIRTSTPRPNLHSNLSLEFAAQKRWVKKNHNAQHKVFVGIGAAVVFWLALKGDDQILMTRLVVFLLLLALSNAVGIDGERDDGQCKIKMALVPRPHSVSILEFGAVGDGKTLNTIAFQNAIFYLKSFADKGGAQLYVPSGRWLTGSFSLTSHLTLFLEGGAIILGTQDPSHWGIVEPLPSYGRGIELPGGRYRSLITGYNLTDVMLAFIDCAGDNGTIDGQGSVWWEWFNSHSLNYSRPHLVELISSDDILVSNLTFLNSPGWHIHPVYCSNVRVHNITIHAPYDSPDTYGIVPDSSDNVCIENCTISVGYDAIALKSGWDEYGIAYGRPTTNVHIRAVHLQASSGSGLAFGSEMSGGISNVRAELLHVHDSFTAIKFKTTRGRGGYIKDILISDVEMENIHNALEATGQYGSHPDDNFDPNALPIVDRITLNNVIGTNITVAGILVGIQESPFTSICLSNITLSINTNSSTYWVCSNVIGYSESVFPEPCPNLQGSYSNSSSACFSFLHLDDRAEVL